MNSSGKTFPLLHAWDLLLAAVAPARRQDFGRRIREEFIDWPRVIELAAQHGVTSLLYQEMKLCQESIPPEFFSRLRQSYEGNVHRSLFLTRELMRVLDCLEQQGIQAIPYKGVVMAETYYGDMAARQAGDMDLFVRAEDIVRAKAAVRELGYTPRTAIPKSAEANYIASGYECSFDSAAGQNLLELQWALQPRFYAVDFDMNGLFARAGETQISGRTVKTPSPEDLLIVLSVHAAKHLWGRLIWLCDIARILPQEKLDWRSVRTSARELGIERILHVTLLLAKELVGAPLPGDWDAVLSADLAAQALAAEITNSIVAGTMYDAENFSYFRWMLRLRERRWDRARFAARLAFTPGPGEWEAVRLPRALFPFYFVVRMGRLAARLAGWRSRKS